MSLPNDIVPDRDEARRRQAEDPLLGSAATAAEAAGLACPDAELLGLYAERALSRAEAAAIETHVRGCARCEDVVATIARALPASAAADEAGATTDAGVAGWLRGWRWMVPVMSLAGAAAVAFWLGRSPVPVAEMDMARTEAGPAGAASPGTPRADADKDAFAKQAAPPAVPVAQTPPAAAGASASAVGPALADRVGRVGPTAPNTVTLEAANTAKAVGATGAAGASATAAEEATSAKSMAESLEARREIAAPAETMAAPAAAPAPPPARLAARERAAEPKTTGNVAADAASPAPASGAAASQSVAGAGAAASTVGAADLRAAFPRWRVRDGRVEFARDGKAWRRVTLPTSERVTSVTERPDGTVLVITASGVQFVSANLGATWQRQ